MTALTPTADADTAQDQPRRLVIGIGNPLRGDDGLGHRLTERLKSIAPDELDIKSIAGGALELMDAWRDADEVVVVDATSSGAAPGTIRRFDAARENVPACLERASTHGFSLPEAIELARNIGELPRELIVYGIEGEHFGYGSSLSPQVEQAVDRLVETLAS